LIIPEDNKVLFQVLARGQGDDWCDNIRDQTRNNLMYETAIGQGYIKWQSENKEKKRERVG